MSIISAPIIHRFYGGNVTEEKFREQLTQNLKFENHKLNGTNGSSWGLLGCDTV